MATPRSRHGTGLLLASLDRTDADHAACRPLIEEGGRGRGHPCTDSSGLRSGGVIRPCGSSSAVDGEVVSAHLGGTDDRDEPRSAPLESCVEGQESSLLDLSKGDVLRVVGLGPAEAHRHAPGSVPQV